MPLAFLESVPGFPERHKTKILTLLGSHVPLFSTQDSITRLCDLFAVYLVAPRQESQGKTDWAHHPETQTTIVSQQPSTRMKLCTVCKMTTFTKFQTTFKVYELVRLTSFSCCRPVFQVTLPQTLQSVCIQLQLLLHSISIIAKLACCNVATHSFSILAKLLFLSHTLGIQVI